VDEVEYVDEMGRTRWGTAAEAVAAAGPVPSADDSSYAEVM
jgi:hypothetical protein